MFRIIATCFAEVDADLPLTACARPDTGELPVSVSTAREWALGPAVSRGATHSLVNTRELPFMNMGEFFMVYVDTCEGNPCSLSTFRRAFTEGEWSKHIICVPIGPHSVCSRCTYLIVWGKMH